MLETIHCHNCGASSYSPGIVTVTLTLSASGRCSYCDRHHTDKHEIWFCSTSCLVQYVQKREAELTAEVTRFAEALNAYLPDPKGRPRLSR
jgi:hypothetical protein